MIREIIESLNESEVKNNINTVKKELLKRFGRDVQLIGQHAAESGKRAGDLVTFSNDRATDKPMWYKQTVFEINGKFLVIFKNVGTNKGLGYKVFDSKKELTQNWDGKDLRSAGLYDQKNSQDKATWDLTPLLDILGK